MEHVRFGMVDFIKHTAIIVQCAMMAAKILSFPIRKTRHVCYTQGKCYVVIVLTGKNIILEDVHIYQSGIQLTESQ